MHCRRKNLCYHLLTMLSLMRKHAYSWTVRVVLFLLVVVFVFWGIGSGLFSRIRPLAIVNGHKILALELNQEVDQIRRAAQEKYGANAAAMLKGIDLRQYALSQIIDRTLVEDEARRLGLRVSDARLRRAIAQAPAFQVNGSFDFAAYQRVLRASGLLPAEFEASTRSSLLADMARQVIEQAVVISDAEARHEFRLRNERLELSYIEVPYARFLGEIHPSAAEIADFYGKNQERFRLPERTSIKYIRYDPETLASGFTPTDRQVQTYYADKRETLFRHPEQVRARHILIRLEASATTAQKEAAKAQAREILARAERGEVFAALASRYSQDEATRQQGGDLGWFSRGQLVKPFEEAAFKLNPGGMTVALSPFGYHVIRVDEVRPAATETIDQARPAIVAALRGQEGRRLARQAADSDLSAALSGIRLAALAQKHALSVESTGPFPQDAPPKELARRPEVVSTAFALSPGQTRVVEEAGSYYLVRVVTRAPSTIPPLAQVEDAVRDELSRTLAASKAQNLAARMLKEMHSPADFEPVAAANNLPLGKSTELSRASDLVPGIGKFPEAIEAAAALTTVPGIVNRALGNGSDWYLIKLLSRRPPSEQAWLAARSDFEDQLLEERRQRTWTRFVEELKRRAQIEIDTNQLG